jgi:hypothetical protein
MARMSVRPAHRHGYSRPGGHPARPSQRAAPCALPGRRARRPGRRHLASVALSRPSPHVREPPDCRPAPRRRAGQRILGHAQITTTLNVYTHLFDAQRHADELTDRMATSAFARLLDPSPERHDHGGCKRFPHANRALVCRLGCERHCAGALDQNLNYKLDAPSSRSARRARARGRAADSRMELGDSNPRPPGCDPGLRGQMRPEKAPFCRPARRPAGVRRHGPGCDWSGDGSPRPGSWMICGRYRSWSRRRVR